MPYHLYIIYSPALNQYYTGHTDNLDDRIFRHTNSGSKSTKKANDWQLVYIEAYETRSEAMQREKAIKKKKSRKYIEELVSSVSQGRPDGSREGHRLWYLPQKLKIGKTQCESYCHFISILLVELRKFPFTQKSESKTMIRLIFLMKSPTQSTTKTKRST